MNTFASLDDALTALEDGDIEAVIHDAPILRYAVREGDHDVDISNGVLIRDDYAFAFPEGSALREQVNLALLSILFEPVWQDIRRRYLGQFEDESI